MVNELAHVGATTDPLAGIEAAQIATILRTARVPTIS